jgi:hypothetical protein
VDHVPKGGQIVELLAAIIGAEPEQPDHRR